MKFLLHAFVLAAGALAGAKAAGPDCKGSYLNDPPLNLLLVIDDSYSTYDDTFTRTTEVGDQNNDGKADTVLDAEIAAAKSLLETIVESDILDNSNVNIGLVVFNTEATYLGNFPPTNEDGNAINPELLNHLTGLSTPKTLKEVFTTRVGFTNMDDALDKAILYFEDEGLHFGTNLMLFLGDGEPNVRGDGDGEVGCFDPDGFCKDVPDTDIYDDAWPEWDNGRLSFCFMGDTQCKKHPLKKCVHTTRCQGNKQAQTFDSELKRLDELEVVRYSIGVGPKSNVTKGSALWLIDGNEMKEEIEFSPPQVLDSDGLINILSDLCTLAPDPPTPKRFPPSASGDPHFKTWTGDKFDYHGECDLVLVDNPTFNDGQGLKVHIRTTRVKYFSYIERVAVQIGNDVLEFANDAENFLINGKHVEENHKHHKTPLGGFPLRRDKKAISIRLHDVSRKAKNGHNVAKIDLLTRKNGFPAVIIASGDDDTFKGSLGLLGDWSTGRRLARDGVTEIAIGHDGHAADFAEEWQVLNTEPVLFSELRAPQYPVKCIPPKPHNGRLGSASMRKEAEKACAHWEQDMDDCIFDVMATRDVLVAAEGHIVHTE